MNYLHRFLFVGLILLIGSQPVSAQVCNKQIPASTPLHRFSIFDNGTVKDKKTGLIWMRCAVGQAWDGKTCRGSAQRFSWDQAQLLTQQGMQQKAQLENSTYLNWRLATVKELSSIVELQCENPAINADIFPNTPSFHFWTATPFTNKNQSHWLIQSQYGENHTDLDSTLAHIRLVAQTQE